MSDEAIVSDTGPIIALSQIGRLDLLQRLFERTIIPPAVRRELRTVSPPNWIEERAPAHQIDALGLAGGLDAGEREVIALALELRDAPVLIDDRPARLQAERLGVTVIGTLGVLVRAKDRGLIVTIRPLLDALQQAKFFMSDRLFQQLLRAVGENG